MRGVRVLLRSITSRFAVLTTLLGATVPGALAAPAAGTGCPAGTRPPAGQHLPGVPWAQRRYQPQRLAGIADGTRVTVAVIDSGVDGNHPQLLRSVLRGRDFLPGGRGGDGRTDCVAHGTAVASIIAAAPVPGTGFVGLAPGARILPIRVAETGEVATGGRAGTASGLAQAIGAAVRDGARVLNVSMVLYRDDPRVRQAVRDALRSGAVVVAAAGNAHGRTAGADPVPYPAGYPGVIGVGAVDEQGQRLDGSQVGSYVDIVAPGSGVTAAVPSGGLGYFSGTSFAAPFVSATAALILSRHPDTTAGEVAARITGSADPAPDPGGQYGSGVLNPYRAVTEVPAPAARSPLGAPVPAGRQALAGPDPYADALAIAGTVTAVAAAVLLLAAVASRGTRRRWRPGNR